MLRSPAAAESLRAELCPNGPYTDPALKHHPLAYADFVAELRQRGMVKYRRAAGRSATVGVFFVAKISGDL
eukprot:3038263-Pyramimonas_sp.AAC.1